jgi:hypothetical protein
MRTGNNIKLGVRHSCLTGSLTAALTGRAPDRGRAYSYHDKRRRDGWGNSHKRGWDEQQYSYARRPPAGWSGGVNAR